MKGLFSKPNRHGYTLMEVVLVVAVISILVGIALPSISAYGRNGREMERADHESLVKRAISQYYAYMGAYPDLSGLDPLDDADAPLPELITLQAEQLRDGLKSVTSVRINTALYNFFYDEGTGRCRIALK